MQSEKSLNLANTFSFSTITCTNCNSTWLVPGLLDGDSYDCKSCGFNIVVEGPVPGEALASANPVTPEERAI